MAAEQMVESVSEALERGYENVSEAADAARARFDDLESRARTFIQEYPLAAVAGAVVAGYVVARLLPRR